MQGSKTGSRADRNGRGGFGQHGGSVGREFEERIVFDVVLYLGRVVLDRVGRERCDLRCRCQAGQLDSMGLKKKAKLLCPILVLLLMTPFVLLFKLDRSIHTGVPENYEYGSKTNIQTSIFLLQVLSMLSSINMDSLFQEKDDERLHLIRMN